MAPLILIVDDHADTRDVFRISLETAGYRAALAPDGSAGLRTARALRPDVVLMDLTMPVMDGWTAAAAFRRDPLLRDTFLMAVTAQLLSGSIMTRTEALFDRILPKPLSPRVLCQAVADALQTRPGIAL